MHAHSRQTSKPGPNTDRILEIVNYKHTQCHLFRTSKSQSIHSAIYLQIAKVIIIHWQKLKHTQCHLFTTWKSQGIHSAIHLQLAKSKHTRCQPITTAKNRNVHSVIYLQLATIKTYTVPSILQMVTYFCLLQEGKNENTNNKKQSKASKQTNRPCRYVLTSTFLKNQCQTSPRWVQANAGVFSHRKRFDLCSGNLQLGQWGYRCTKGSVWSQHGKRNSLRD